MFVCVVFWSGFFHLLLRIYLFSVGRMLIRIVCMLNSFDGEIHNNYNLNHIFI